jgi:hypothetical protein
MHIDSISYNGKDLKKYFPAGLAFDLDNGIQYRFRIIIDDSSLRPTGTFIDEETFLRDISSTIEKKSEQNQMELAGGEQPPLSVNIKTSGNFFIPTGFLKEKFKYGYGGIFSLSLRNIGITYQNKSFLLFEISAKSGIWNLVPKSANPATDVTHVNAYIIPIYLSLNCPIKLTKEFSIIPSASAGYNYNALSYTNLQGKKVNANAFITSFMAELSMEYTRWNVPFHVGSGYVMMFEKSRNLGMLSISGGVGYVF